MVKRKNQVLIDSESDGSLNVSGSDLDSEFLSLAKKKKSNVKRDDTNSALPPNESKGCSDSVTSDSDDDWDARGKGKKKKKSKSAKKSSKKSTKSESESEEESEPKSEPEEGEVEESDSSSDESSDMSDEFNDGYDDNLMGDEEDQARLAQMTEKEREQEIFKRIEQREVMKTRFEIEKKLRLAKRKDQKKKKAQEKLKIEAKERSKERKKTVEENKGKVDKKAQAMNALKARREEKKEREEKEKEKQRLEQEKQQEEEIVEPELEECPPEEEKTTRKKLKASDIYSDDSGSDGEASVKSEPRKKSSSSTSSRSDSDSESDRRSILSIRGKPKRPQFISAKEDLHKIKLSRHKVERWIHLPIFPRIAKGCFVRIGIGTNNGKAVYRVAEVIDIVETGKIYQLGTTRTNKGFKLRHGSNERVFRLEFISNQEFSDTEFTKWKDACTQQGIPLPAMDDIEKKRKELQDAINYEYKEEDIEQIIKEKERFKKTTHNYAMKKTMLMKERDMALAKGDDILANTISKELQELEERAEELDKIRTSSISSISYINERNRKKNVEEAEKAILEELRANKGKKVDDPFTRRSTKPRIVHKSLENQMEFDAVVPIIDTPKAMEEERREEMEEEVPVISPCKEKQKIIKTGDLFSAHNFDIKIDLEMPLPNIPISVAPKLVETVRESAPRRSLNLEDYKKKRGLI